MRKNPTNRAVEHRLAGQTGVHLCLEGKLVCFGLNAHNLDMQRNLHCEVPRWRRRSAWSHLFDTLFKSAAGSHPSHSEPCSREPRAGLAGPAETCLGALKMRR